MTVHRQNAQKGIKQGRVGSTSDGEAEKEKEDEACKTLEMRLFWDGL